MCISSMCQANQIFHIKLILLLSIFARISAISHEKVHEQVVQPFPETSIKCGECPCANPCSQQLPPPPPPPPPMITQYCPPPPQPQAPPPPRFYYFTGPPELSQLTPPPPRFTYVIGGPQENLYPIDPFNLQIFNGATCNCNVLVVLLLPIICGLLEILIF